MIISEQQVPANQTYCKNILTKEKKMKVEVLEKLQNNKGTVSTALSKSFAQDVLKGDTAILTEAIALMRFDDKNVRSGAAKIIESVAEKKPEYVYKDLNKLFPALDVPEPQTRWMTLHVFGLCAKLNPDLSQKALPKCKQFLKEDSGTCLWDRSITYLGYLGAVSEKTAIEVFPILESTLVTIPERTTRIFEGFERMIPVLNTSLKSKMKKVAGKYANDKSPSIKSKASKILKLLKKD
jgi:hypothetical protein